MAYFHDPMPNSITQFGVEINMDDFYRESTIYEAMDDSTHLLEINIDDQIPQLLLAAARYKVLMAGAVPYVRSLFTKTELDLLADMYRHSGGLEEDEPNYLDMFLHHIRWHLEDTTQFELPELAKKLQGMTIFETAALTEHFELHCNDCEWGGRNLTLVAKGT